LSPGISFLNSQAVGIVHPVASFRVNLARFPIPAVPSGLRKAGPPLTLEPQPWNCLSSKRLLRHRSLGYLFWTDFSAATPSTMLRAPAASLCSAASLRTVAG